MLQIGVLMGGKSIEREVSFNSGRTICDHLDTSRYTVIPLFQNKNQLYILPWRFLHRGKTTDFIHRLESQAESISWHLLKNILDFVYIAQHGRYAEDGCLQGTLRILGIPFLASGVLASALSIHRGMQKVFLRAANIVTPEHLYVSSYQAQQMVKDKKKYDQIVTENVITFPCVVKPEQEGSSLGVSFVENEKSLYSAIIQAATIDPHLVQSVLIEEYINGTEFTCIVLEDKNGNYIPLVPTEVIPETKIFDYEQKYMPGRATKFTPGRFSSEITKRIQKTCVEVMRALDFRTIARIDGFLTKTDEIMIIDANILSGMGPSSFIFNQAAEMGMGHSDIINYLLETELYRLGKNVNNIKINSGLQKEKKNIAVLFGGTSNEKEVSLDSGRNVVYKLSKDLYTVIPLFVSSTFQLYHITNAQLVKNSTNEIEKSLRQEQRVDWSELGKISDFVFIALHGGFGEDGSVQGMLEMFDIPYNGSGVLSSALCMNKYKTNMVLAANNISIAKNILVTKKEWQKDKNLCIQKIKNNLPFPIIVKPSDDGCSVLVQKIGTEQDLPISIENVFANGKQDVLIEEYIKGMELTVGVIGNEFPHALEPSWSIAKSSVLSIQEKFLPGAGENQTPAPLLESARALVKSEVVHAYKAAQCSGYARIDCFYQDEKISPTGKERVVIIEINTLPALTPATCIFHQAAELGLRPMEFIDKIIQLGFEKHARVENKSEINEQKIL